MKVRSGLRIIGWLATAILAVCVLTWFALSPLAIAVSRPFLAPYGVEILAIEGHTLRPGSLSITRIHLQMHAADGSQSNGEIRDIRVTFSWNDLLSKQANAVTIGSIVLDAVPTIPPSENGEVSDNQDPAANLDDGRLQLATLALVVQELPLESFKIKHLSISPVITDTAIALTRNRRELQATINAPEATAELRMNWHDEDFVSSHFLAEGELPDTTSPQALTGSLQVDHATGNAATIDFSLDEVNGLLALDLSAQLQVSPIHQLLQNFQMNPAFLEGGNYQGLLRATVTAREQPQDNHDSSQRFDFELTLLENSTLAAPLPAYPGASSASFDWQSNAPLALAGSWRPQTGAVLFNGSWQPIDVTVIADGEEKLFRIGLHQLALDCSGRGEAAGGTENVATCTFLQSSDVQMQDFTVGDLTLQDVRAITNSTLDSGNGTTSMRMGPGSRIAIGSANAPGIELHNANFLVQEAVDVAIDRTGVVDLSSNGLELYLPDLRVSDRTAQGVINATNFRAHIPVAEDPLVSAEISVRDIGIEPLPVTPRKPQFDARVDLDQDLVTVDGTLQLAGIDILEITANHELQSGNGNAQVQIPTLQFDELFTNLNQFFVDFPVNADIITGSASGSSELYWQISEETHLEGDLRLDLDSLSGYYEEVAILDFDAVIAGHLTEQGFTGDGMQAVNIASIDPGMPINNISFNYQLDTLQNIAIVADLHANMFSGTIEASDIRYDIAAASSDFEVRLQAIDLTRILSLASYDGVSATGLFSGRIPVKISDGTIAVDGGTINVQPPGGSIHYISPTGSASGNVSLDLVNQALSNYQYDVLKATVDYLPNGELTLSMQLQGGNPDMGQRINLNLNVTDNIPALLQSLQASRNITDAVREGLENR